VIWITSDILHSGGVGVPGAAALHSPVLAKKLFES
jgi:hypothetical protein